MARPRTVAWSPLPPKMSCVKPATCTGSSRGCAFCLDVVRSLYKVLNAAARIVVCAVGRQTTPSFGLIASSSVAADLDRVEAGAGRERQASARVEGGVAVETELPVRSSVIASTTGPTPGSEQRARDGLVLLRGDEAALHDRVRRRERCLGRRGCRLLVRLQARTRRRSQRWPARPGRSPSRAACDSA